METVDFIEGIVSNMTPTVEIDSVVDNGDGTQTLTICNTYWIRKRLTVTIDGNAYVVTSFINNTSITIPTTPLVTVDSFILQAPFYFHGSPISINNEWAIQNKDKNKYPLIYLVESISENYYDRDSSLDKDSPLRVFFLDSFASNKDEVDAHYTNVIVPLNSMASEFVNLLNTNSLIDPFSYVKTNRVKVGVYTTYKGHTDQIFADPLDGVEFVSTVTFIREFPCDCRRSAKCHG